MSDYMFFSNKLPCTNVSWPLKEIYKSTLTNVDNANLNVLKNVLNIQDQHLTIHELSMTKLNS